MNLIQLILLLLIIFQSSICYKFIIKSRFKYVSKIYEEKTGTGADAKKINTVEVEKNDDDVWGVSFIGQDVCGSKYNSDPFLAIDAKQSAFEAFKMKIKAIEERNNQNKTIITNLGQWP